jgi:hypothetical protein
MDISVLVNKIENLIVENERLKQEIKKTRISKNNEIDEVEQLYSKTKQELLDCKQTYENTKEEFFNAKHLIYSLKIGVTTLEEKLNNSVDISKYKQYDFAKEVISLIEFKNNPIFTEFKAHFIKYGVPFVELQDAPFNIKHIEFDTYIIKKYLHLLTKPQILFHAIAELNKTINENYDHPKLINVLHYINILEFLLEIKIDKSNYN